MPVIVELPSVLATRTGSRRRVEVDARTVREAIRAIDAQYPGFATDVLINDSIVRSSLCLVLGGHALTGAAGLDREIADGTTVEIDIVSNVAGG
jgi:predicted phage tail protein